MGCCQGHVGPGVPRAHRPLWREPEVPDRLDSRGVQQNHGPGQPVVRLELETPTVQRAAGAADAVPEPGRSLVIHRPRVETTWLSALAAQVSTPGRPAGQALSDRDGCHTRRSPDGVRSPGADTGPADRRERLVSVPVPASGRQAAGSPVGIPLSSVRHSDSAGTPLSVSTATIARTVTRGFGPPSPVGSWDAKPRMLTPVL